MSFDIYYYFTDNYIKVKGDNAEDFLLDSFQHVVEEAYFLEDTDKKEIKYNFRYHGSPKHKYLVKAEKQFPNVDFELKGYFFPDEYDLGFTKIFFFSNNSLFRCDADKAYIDFESEEKFVSGFFKSADRKLEES